MIPNTIPVFVINLKDRIDRKRHIQNEFRNRDEFDLTIVNACKNIIGAVGLWSSIQYIFKNLINMKNELIVLCEDDHQFTKYYSKERLYKYIKEAKKKEVDILSGGISGFTSALQISENLYWVEQFSGLQFTVIFQKFFQTILGVDFGKTDAADYKMCSLTDNKLFIYPFISVQKGFGYSDVTYRNNKKDRVEGLFNQNIKNIQILNRISTFYKKNWLENYHVNNIDLDKITISTYIINLRERISCRTHIEEQFNDKPEFDITIVESCKHKFKTVGLWLNIQRIVKMGIRNGDDVLVICEHSHEFTEYYSKRFLFQNIIESHEQHADYLSGGTIGFDVAIPITKNRFWVNQCLSTQFIVLYRKFFKRILSESFDDSVIPSLLLSEITSNKMLLYPFISIQKKIGHSNIKSVKLAGQEPTIDLFDKSKERLETIRKAYFKYSQK